MPRTKRLLDPDLPHHVTARSNNREHFPVPLDVAWNIFEDHLYLISSGFDIQILSFVLMPNHFHLIVRDPKLQLPSAMQYFMRETSKEINRKAGNINRVWGSNYYSSLIRTLPYYYSAYRYVYQNPVKAGLCKKPYDYKFSTLSGLLGLTRLAIPVREDLTLFDSVDDTLYWLSDPIDDAEARAIGIGLRRSELEFSVDPITRKPVAPTGLLTHPRYRKV